MSHEAHNWARDLPMEGPRGKRAVLKSLGDHANEYWASWPSRKLIGKETDLAPRSVSNYLRDLVHDGLIVPVPWRNEEGGDAGSGYFLTGMPGAPNFAPVSVAFKDRRYGFPRGRTPEWWSGEKRNGQAPVQDPLWGEGPTHRTPGSHPWEGEGPTGRTPGVPWVGPLEPSVEPPAEPSIKTSSINPLLPASARAEAWTSRRDVLAAADAGNRSTAEAANDERVSSVIQMSDHRSGRQVGAVEEVAAAKPKRQTKSQRLDAERREQIEAMPLERVEKVVAKYRRTHPKGCQWAVKKAREEAGLATPPEADDDGWDAFLRRAYWWALKFHNGKQDWPAALLWAFDEEAVAAQEAEAALRRKRVVWIPCEQGEEDAVLQRMYEVIGAMDPGARSAMADEIRIRKPKVWDESYASAWEQLEGDDKPVETSNHIRLSLQYVVRHYHGSESDVKRWPSFTVPPSMRSDLAAGGVLRAA